MTNPRNEIFDVQAMSVLHIMTRCVRRAFLCGWDKQSQKDYSHRKQWVLDRLQELSASFAIDLCSYAIMSNHMHLIVRNRPDRWKRWSQRTVAKRWLIAHPKRKDKQGRGLAPTEAEIAKLLANPAKIEELRKRLGDISWFMKALDESIARRANQEDNCSGHFWEGRFKAQKILDAAAMLTCSTYVDLNPVRATAADLIEDSAFTSGQVRLQALEAQRALETIDDSLPEPSDEQLELIATLRKQVHSSHWLAPITGSLNNPFAGKIPEAMARHEGIFPMLSTEEYLKILDETGRQIRGDKRGAIAPDVLPILERLEINADHWLETIEHYGSRFYHAVGKVHDLRAWARSNGHNRSYGTASSLEIFKQPHESGSIALAATG